MSANKRGDDDNPEWTEEDFALARPASEVIASEAVAALTRSNSPLRRMSFINPSDELTAAVGKAVLAFMHLEYAAVMAWRILEGVAVRKRAAASSARQIMKAYKKAAEKTNHPLAARFVEFACTFEPCVVARDELIHSNPIFENEHGHLLVHIGRAGERSWSIPDIYAAAEMFDAAYTEGLLLIADALDQ